MGIIDRKMRTGVDRTVSDPQAGLTLVELLAAVVLMGVIILPLLAVFVDSHGRTVSQGEETRMLFYAEEVMERMRLRSDLASDETVDGIYFEKGECTVLNGCVPDIDPDSKQYVTYTVLVTESEYNGMPDFFDLLVEVYPKTGDRRDHPVQLKTVVRKP